MGLMPWRLRHSESQMQRNPGAGPVLVMLCAKPKDLAIVGNHVTLTLNAQPEVYARLNIPGTGTTGTWVCLTSNTLTSQISAKQICKPQTLFKLLLLDYWGYDDIRYPSSLSVRLYSATTPLTSGIQRSHIIVLKLSQPVLIISW